MDGPVTPNDKVTAVLKAEVLLAQHGLRIDQLSCDIETRHAIIDSMIVVDIVRGEGLGVPLHDLTLGGIPVVTRI